MPSLVDVIPTPPEVTSATITELARSLGADPRELLPCASGTKRALVRQYTRPDYATDWDRFLKQHDGKLNVGLLFGQRSRFVGLDCDSSAASDRVRGLVDLWPHVRTQRGSLFLAKANGDPSAVTSSNVLKLRLDGAQAGELRLQHVYSIICGVHPSGVHYDLIARPTMPVIDLKVLVQNLRERGFDVPALRPPRQEERYFDLEAHEPAASRKRRFWTKEAQRLANEAPQRPNGTVGTDPFVFQMTTDLRTRPELAPVVVNAFAAEVSRRGLQIREGPQRLLKELQDRIARWRRSYGVRAAHKPLRDFYQQAKGAEKEQQDSLSVLLRFLKSKKVRKDALHRHAAVARAFIQRAHANDNKSCYEATTALEPMIPRKSLSRILANLYHIGILERAPNSIPSSCPKHRTARWQFRVKESALKLVPVVDSRIRQNINAA